RQREALRRRSPGRVVAPYPRWHVVKTVLYLSLYHLGIYHLVRWVRRTRGASRAVILLYHRVNDLSVDSLTVSTAAFAEHVVSLKTHNRFITSSALVDLWEARGSFPANTVVIHFDDCYRDVWTHAAPILREGGLPAAAFIASGFVGTHRCFEHDRLRSP